MNNLNLIMNNCAQQNVVKWTSEVYIIEQRQPHVVVIHV